MSIFKYLLLSLLLFSTCFAFSTYASHNNRNSNMPNSWPKKNLKKEMDKLIFENETGLSQEDYIDNTPDKEASNETDSDKEFFNASRAGR